jgi:hypothetical protein
MTRRLWYLATNLSIFAVLVVIFGRTVMVVAVTIFGAGCTLLVMWLAIGNLTGRRKREGRDR